MKHFEIKILNKKLMMVIAIPIALAFIFAALVYVVDKAEGENELIITFVVAMIPLLIILILLRKACRKNYIVEINDSEIVIKRNGFIEKSIMIKDLMLIRQISFNNLTSLILFTKGHVNPDIELLQIPNSLTMKEILKTLLDSGIYIETQRISRGQMYKEYINQSMENSEATTIVSLKSDKMPTKAIMIIVSVVALLILVPILAIVISKSTNNTVNYIFERDGVYFKDKKLAINRDEVNNLNYNLIKDSSHVYYKGEVLEWADRATFKYLQSPFYSDKNGVYYETNKFFSENQILPLPGDYDHATFRSVGSSYYKDKNNLYKLNLGLISSDDNPLVKVDLEGIDLSTFTGVGDNTAYYWFKDKNRVYFASEKNLKIAEGIDVSTFEVISWEVAKDKNHVYYITKDLESDGHRATDHSDYAILKGADTSTFEEVGYNKFRDKDSEWDIDR